MFKQYRSVFKAYFELVDHSAQGIGRLATRRRSRRGPPPPENLTDPQIDSIDIPVDARNSDGYLRASRELAAARRKREVIEEKQRVVNATALAEQENETTAQREGTMQECGCCCSEYPMNRMLICENPDASAQHWLCWTCVKTYVETEIGQSRHKLVCFHVDGCTFGFSKPQLKLAIPLQHLKKLEKLQQEDEVRCAELDGLEECPFCDYKAICPPKEVDKEFRCNNDDCGIVSCRLCQLETHIPLSCEERAKASSLDARHTVEEAMTAALIRTCK